jgi:hypothetical protein
MTLKTINGLTEVGRELNTKIVANDRENDAKQKAPFILLKVFVNVSK